MPRRAAMPAASGAGDDRLLERNDELEVLDGVVEDGLAGEAVLVVITGLRRGELPVEASLLDEITNRPGTVAVRPQPLSEAASADLVRSHLGAGPEEPFWQACHHATGGNPL